VHAESEQGIEDPRQDEPPERVILRLGEEMRITVAERLHLALRRRFLPVALESDEGVDREV
jgi:hypothetical protein